MCECCLSPSFSFALNRHGHLSLNAFAYLSVPWFLVPSIQWAPEPAASANWITLGRLQRAVCCHRYSPFYQHHFKKGNNPYEDRRCPGVER